ncbi:MAG TPA: hypothetical protein VHY31_03630 [Streptosporangiaceae bacterium]|nr:hypothetical protein [Streptosporangiaceae bacterium]
MIWSDEVFAHRPPAGLAATMLGPALAGIVVDRTGASIAFALAAALVALNLTMAPPRTLRSAPLATLRLRRAA